MILNIILPNGILQKSIRPLIKGEIQDLQISENQTKIKPTTKINSDFRKIQFNYPEWKPYLDLLLSNSALFEDRSTNSIFSSKFFFNVFHSPTALIIYGSNLPLPNLCKEIIELMTDFTVATGDVNGDQ